MEKHNTKEPTTEELRAFFLTHDFTATAHQIDYDGMDSDDVELIETLKATMDKPWESLAREMGLKSPSSFYGADNPAIVLRDGVENATALKAMEILDAQPDIVDKIMNVFITEKTMQDPEKLKRIADEMLREKVEMLMQVMDYEAVANIAHELPAHEDFNNKKQNNFRAIDFLRHWNHTRSSMKTISLNELQETALEDGGDMLADPTAQVAEQAISRLSGAAFWESLSSEDRTMLQMRMAGATQAEIAKVLGLNNHSAVSKRLQKLKEEFLKK